MTIKESIGESASELVPAATPTRPMIAAIVVMDPRMVPWNAEAKKTGTARQRRKALSSPPVRPIANSDVATPRSERRLPTSGEFLLRKGMACIAIVYAVTPIDAATVSGLMPIAMRETPTPTTSATHCSTD